VKEGATELLEPEELKAALQSSSDESLVVGDAGVLPEGFLRGMHHAKVARPKYPYAVALAEIGAGKYERGEFPAPDDIRPLYLREPDVNINWEKIRRDGPWASE
jgi:tRNA A37 threonylcarbamoyladenosine modification protein TsaB